jgi:hypothetical protein
MNFTLKLKWTVILPLFLLSCDDHKVGPLPVEINEEKEVPILVNWKATESPAGWHLQFAKAPRYLFIGFEDLEGIHQSVSPICFYDLGAANKSSFVDIKLGLDQTIAGEIKVGQYVPFHVQIQIQQRSDSTKKGQVVDTAMRLIRMHLKHLSDPILVREGGIEMYRCGQFEKERPPDSAKEIGRELTLVVGFAQSTESFTQAQRIQGLKRLASRPPQTLTNPDEEN